MRVNDDGVTVLCPDGVIERLFDALALAGKPEYKARHYAVAVLDTVFRRRPSDKSKAAEFVHIPYQAFHESIPNRQVAWAKGVVSEGAILPAVIDWKKDYWFDPTRQLTGECMAYRPSAEYRGVKPVSHRIKDYKLAKKLRASAETSRKEAARRIESDPCGLLSGIERNVLSTTLYELPESLAAEPIVDHFAGRRRHWCDECPMGRVHTHVGNTPSSLRHYLRFNSRKETPLVLLDIANSQPLVLGLSVCEISALVSGQNCNTGTTPTPPAPGPQGGHHPTPTTPGTPPPRTAVRFSPRQPLDHKASWYVQACLDGLYYERVAELSGEPEWKFGRDGAKQANMVFAYGDVAMTDNACGRVVRKMDPLFYDWLVYAKTIYPDGLLAKLMQRKESELMIQRVCRRLLAERPDRPLVPIHDAFLCLPEDADDFVAVIEDEWRARFGVVPRVRRECLGR